MDEAGVTPRDVCSAPKVLLAITDGNVNEPEDGASLDTEAWSNSLREFGPKYMSPEFYDKVSLPESQGDGIKLKEETAFEGVDAVFLF